MNDHGNIQLVGEVVKLLWKSPSLGKSFYSLSAGDDCKEINLDDMDKIDLPRIRKQRLLSNFGKRVHLRKMEEHSTHEETWTTYVTVGI